MTESHEKLIERLTRVLNRMQRDLDSMPPGKGGGLYIDIQLLEQRIKREKLHAVSGYRTPRKPVPGGAPGTNRRK